MKKISLSILIAMFLVLMFQPWKAEAAENTTSGTFGETLTWEYEDGTLTISGEGYTSHFSSEKHPPWYHLRNDIHTIVVSEGVAFLGDGIFLDHNNVTKVQLHSGISAIGIKAFMNCYNLEDINIPDRVSFIGEKAFHNCSSLKSITIPNAVTDIGGDAFYGCTGLESVTLSNSLSRLSPCMFRDCKSLTRITLPRIVDCISWYTFSGCDKLKEVEITGDLEIIDYYAFEGCESLESLDLPASLRYIGEKAFYSCKNIKEIRFHGDMPKMRSMVFELLGHEDFSCNLYYPVNNKTWTQEKMDKALWFYPPYAKFVPYGTPECDHEVITVPGKEAGCTEAGLTEKQYCSKCNKVLKDHSSIEPFGHDFKITTVAPTCIEVGYDLHICTRCQKEERQNETAALEHSFGEWEITKHPTEEEAGLQTRSCIHCQEQQKQEIAPLTPSETPPSTDSTIESPTENATETSTEQDADHSPEPALQGRWIVIVLIVVVLLVIAIFLMRQHTKHGK